MDELNRRLGRFEEAQKHLELLKDDPRFQGNVLGNIVEFQLALIAAKDSSPHTVQEARGSKTNTAP